MPDPALGEDELLDRVTAAALDQFAEFGIRRSTIDDVARRAGVSRISVFRRVASKQGLVEIVIAREIRRGMTELDAPWEARKHWKNDWSSGSRSRALRQRPSAVRPAAAQRTRVPAAAAHRRRRTGARAVPVPDRRPAARRNPGRSRGDTDVDAPPK